MAEKSGVNFPEGFLWGAATAGYQIEGSRRADGAGESVWDEFARKGGTYNGDTAEIAADHYHRFAEDHALAKSLGLRALRMSISWPRISPDGSSSWNQAGFDHYARVFDSLEAQGIAPMVTLFHWDLPLALHEKGGWLNRDTAQRFADYAGEVTKRFGDRIPYWITTNEPWSVAFLGHARGLHAPGMRDYRAAGTAAHHLMLAHGLAVPAIRANIRKAQLGITLCLQIAEPFSNSPSDIEAARLVEAEANGIFLQPLLKGGYPEEILPFLPSLSDPGVVRSGDLELIAAPIDFLGLNYYVHEIIRFDRSVPLISARRIPPIGPANSYGNALRPGSIEDILLKPSRDYGSKMPIYVTEVGNLFNDYVSPDGEVKDPDRIDYFDGAFRGVAKAIDRGADVRGIFVWTLIDDFEWDAGYSARYGIIYVDYRTQTRIPKSSARWFSGVVAENRL